MEFVVITKVLELKHSKLFSVLHNAESMEIASLNYYIQQWHRWQDHSCNIHLTESYRI